MPAVEDVARAPQSWQSVPNAHKVDWLSGPPSEQMPLFLSVHVSRHTTIREPQSVQSVPASQEESALPSPPSEQMPLFASAPHESSHKCPGDVLEVSRRPPSSVGEGDDGGGGGVGDAGCGGGGSSGAIASRTCQCPAVGGGGDG